jgi:diguanylate cyclase (GGDEF)-like protein
MAFKEDYRFLEPTYIDSLTGLRNRYFLNIALPEFMEKAKEGQSLLGILMLDMDGFKNINDTYGHLKGDAILKLVAKILDTCVRGEDVVIRYAGDEFIVLLMGREEASKSLEAFIAASKRIIEKFAKTPMKVDSQEFIITFSAGLAIYPQDGKTQEALIDAADKALYLSKEKGKGILSLAEEVTQQVIVKQEVSRLFTATKFIDRAQQLQQLKSIFAEVNSNKTYIVLVEGRAGIGKTRLLDEFKNLADLQKIITLKISASEKHILQPYYVFCQALSESLGKNNLLFNAIGDFLSQEEAMALASLMPQFKSFIKETAKAASEGQGYNIFKALRHICVELSSSGLLLYFDNMQYLDKATFELINYLLHYEFVRKVMVCGAFNQEEIMNDSALAEFLSSPKDKINFLHMELPVFSLEDTKELIATIFMNIVITEDFNKYIYDITEGIPLFILELLKYLVESGIILYKENRWQLLEFKKEDIPSSLEEVLLRRFRKLDPETKEMLAKAVVIGEDFEADMLREVIKKDQGYLFELLDRAKKKTFVGTQEKMDKFSFNPSMFQKVMYDKMQSSEKNQLHQEIVRALEQVYKSESGKILGDLVYHYERSGDYSKFREYKEKIMNESLEVFNPAELDNYLEALDKETASLETPRELRIQKIDSQISEQALEKVADLIRYIFAAVRNIALYPPANKIRESSFEKVYEVLKAFLMDTSSVTFSEVEKILLVNNKRIRYQQEKALAIDDFITLMIDRDIKGIQFLSALEKEELGAFLEIIALNPQELRAGEIAQKLKGKNIRNIKLDVASYKRAATQERFKSLSERMNKMMLMDFVSGKSRPKEQDLENLLRAIKQEPQNLANSLTDAARSFLPRDKELDPQEQAKIISEGIQKLAKELYSRQDPDSQKDLNRLIASLDDTIKSYLFSQQDLPLYRDIAKSLNDKEIADLILAAKKMPEKDKLLYMRELYNKFIVSSPRSQEFVLTLDQKLKDSGLNESEISFITQKEYETLSVQERVETITKLPPQTYSSVGEDNVRNLIKELIDNQDTANLGILIRHLLSELQLQDDHGKEEIFKLIGLFFSSLSSGALEFDSIVAEVIEALIKEFSQGDFAISKSTLGYLGLAMQWCYGGAFTNLVKDRWVMRARFEQINKIINALSATLNEQADSLALNNKKSLIKEFILNLSGSQLMPAMAIELKDPFLDYNNMITGQIIKLGRDCLRQFLSAVLENRDFSWEGELYRSKVAKILKTIGQDAIDEVKNYLSLEDKPEKVRGLIEIAGLLKSDDLVPVIGNFINRREYEIKEEVIFALANIATPQAKEMISNLTSDRDTRVAALAKRQSKA